MITLTRAQAIAMIRDALRQSGWDVSDESWLDDAIRALTERTASARNFQRDEYVLWEGELHRVICADEDTAVLAPSRHYPEEGRTNTDYTKLFAVSNRPELYETIADRVTRVDEELALNMTWLDADDALPIRPEISE
jgi:hypothetical protein